MDKPLTMAGEYCFERDINWEVSAVEGSVGAKVTACAQRLSAGRILFKKNKMIQETALNIEDTVCEECGAELPKGVYVITSDGFAFCDNDRCFYEFYEYDSPDFNNDEYHPERY